MKTQDGLFYSSYGRDRTNCRKTFRKTLCEVYNICSCTCCAVLNCTCVKKLRVQSCDKLLRKIRGWRRYCKEGRSAELTNTSGSDGQGFKSRGRHRIFSLSKSPVNATCHFSFQFAYLFIWEMSYFISSSVLQSGNVPLLNKLGPRFGKKTTSLNCPKL